MFNAFLQEHYEVQGTHWVKTTAPGQWAQPLGSNPRAENIPTASFRWNESPYVPWGLVPGAENQGPDRIQELYLRSSYFRRITDDKAGQLKGEGLQLEGPQHAAARAWLAEVGLTDELLEALCYDLALLNGFALQVVWNRGRTRVAQLAHQRLAQVRAHRPNPNKPNDPAQWWVHPQWAAVDARANLRPGKRQLPSPTKLPSYNPQKPDDLQLLVARKYNPLCPHYPLPDADTVWEELNLAHEVLLYQRNYVNNGMATSGILYVPFTPESTGLGGELTENDHKRMQERREALKHELTGTQRSGQLTIIWFNPHLSDRNGNPIGVPRLEQPPQDRNEQKFIEVQRESRQSFLTGLGVISPELVGIPSAGGFSSQAD